MNSFSAKLLIAMLAATMMAAPALAEVIFLKNGKRIQGEIERIRNTKIAIRLAAASNSFGAWVGSSYRHVHIKDIDFVLVNNWAVIKPDSLQRIFERNRGHVVPLSQMYGSEREQLDSVLEQREKAIALFQRSQLQDENSINLGVGMGIPYGGIMGMNLDGNIVRNFNISVGAGRLFIAETGSANYGYNFGGKLFLAPFEQAFRSRISAYYGNNGVQVQEKMMFLPWSSPTKRVEITRRYYGVSVGFGAQWMWGRTKRNGLDFDIIYIVTDGGLGNAAQKLRDEGYDVQESRIKVSFGVRFAF